MAWLNCIIIAAVVSLAAFIIRPWRRRKRYVKKLDLQAPKMGFPAVRKEPELAVAPHNSCTLQHPVAEPVADGLTGLKTRCCFAIWIRGY